MKCIAVYYENEQRQQEQRKPISRIVRHKKKSPNQKKRGNKSPSLIQQNFILASFIWTTKTQGYHAFLIPCGLSIRSHIGGVITTSRASSAFIRNHDSPPSAVIGTCLFHKCCGVIQLKSTCFIICKRT